MKKIKLFTLIILTGWLSSCQKYLEKPNRLQASITTVEQLQALLDGRGTSSHNNYDFPSVFYTDDTYIDTAAYRLTPTLNIIGLHYYTFDVSNMAANTLNYEWSVSWNDILQANLILSLIDDVSGTQSAKDAVKASAFFMRAYAYFRLVNDYCQPYSSSTLQSQGLPLRKTTSYDESLVRSSLQDTYRFILSDVIQAKSLLGTSDVNPSYRWRVSNTAVEAFLSRYYLFTGDYTSSVTHANNALSSSNASLVDFNSIGSATSSSTYPNPIPGGTPATYTVTYSALSQYTQAQAVQWPEFYYVDFYATPFGQWYASPSLVALYDQTNDIRYIRFLPPNSGFAAGWKKAGLYAYKSFSIGGLNSLPTGPTVAEVLLNKAEASARNGDVTTAMATVNILRAKRFKAGSSYLLSALDAPTALSQVLQERHRELPFAFRFWDIRRFANNETTADDVQVDHLFFTVNSTAVDLTTSKNYVLPVKSTRYAMPIPNQDIAASNGQLTQTIY